MYAVAQDLKAAVGMCLQVIGKTQPPLPTHPSLLRDAPGQR